MIPGRPQKGEIWILFDGVCLLCLGWVRFLIRQDKKKIFKFCSLQDFSSDDVGNFNSWPDSIVVISDQGVLFKAEAVLLIIRHLPFPWRLFYAFRWLPTAILNWFYDFIARNRYRWFGKQSVCEMPAPEIRDRFLNLSSKT